MMGEIHPGDGPHGAPEIRHTKSLMQHTFVSPVLDQPRFHHPTTTTRAKTTLQQEQEISHGACAYSSFLKRNSIDCSKF